MTKIWMWTKCGSHTKLVKMQNGKTTLENNYVVSHKYKTHLSYDPAIPLPGNENMSTGKLISKCSKQPKPEKNHMSI